MAEPSKEQNIESQRLEVEKARLAVEVEKLKLENQRTYLEQWETDIAPRHTSIIESSKAAIGFGQNLLRGTFLVNGGTLIALPTFMTAMLTRPIIMKDPKTGERYDCGSRPETWAWQVASNPRREEDCVRDYQMQGWVRSPQ